MRHIALMGALGSGKTTTAIALADRLGALVVAEDHESNPFLHRVYKDPEKYACANVATFSSLHWAQLSEARATGRDIVSDFCPGNALCYARVSLTDPMDWAAFTAVHERNIRLTPPADLTVFLDVPVDVILERIQRRVIEENRPYESGVSLDFVANLRQAFMDHLRDLDSPAVRISLAGTETREQVTDLVMRQVLQLGRGAHELA